MSASWSLCPSSLPLSLPLLHLGWLCQCLGLLLVRWVPSGRSWEGAQVWVVVVWQGSQEQAGCHSNETDNTKWLNPDIPACFAVHWHRVWVNGYEHCNFMHVSYLRSDWQTLKVLILTSSQLKPSTRLQTENACTSTCCMCHASIFHFCLSLECVLDLNSELGDLGYVDVHSFASVYYTCIDSVCMYWHLSGVCTVWMHACMYSVYVCTYVCACVCVLCVCMCVHVYVCMWICILYVWTREKWCYFMMWFGEWCVTKTIAPCVH